MEIGQVGGFAILHRPAFDKLPFQYCGADVVQLRYAGQMFQDRERPRFTGQQAARYPAQRERGGTGIPANHWSRRCFDEIRSPK